VLVEQAQSESKFVPLKGVTRMYDGGCFGGFTRWAVVFLIIFVLFILLVPFTGGSAGAGY
jgi:hypothetical protein